MLTAPSGKPSPEVWGERDVSSLETASPQREPLEGCPLAKVCSRCPVYVHKTRAPEFGDSKRVPFLYTCDFLQAGRQGAKDRSTGGKFTHPNGDRVAFFFPPLLNTTTHTRMK